MSGVNIPPNQMLDFGETALFKLKGHQNIFVRLGNLADGTCFFQSFLQSYCGKNFIALERKEARKVLERFRQGLAAFMTLEKFASLKLNPLLGVLYQKYYEQAFNQLSDNEIKTRLFSVMSIKNREFSPLTVDSIKETLSEDLAAIYEKVNQRAFSLLQKNLAKYSEYADEMELALVGEIYDVNILVLNENGIIIRDDEEMLSNGKPFILAYYMNRIHYECVGIARKDESGKMTVNFIFDGSDEDIIKLFRETRMHKEKEAQIREFKKLRK